MAKNKLRIYFDYNCQAVDAYDANDSRYDQNPSTSVPPDCNDGFAIYKDANNLWLPMASKWFRIPIPADTTRTFSVKVYGNGAIKQISFWRDETSTQPQHWDTRDDGDDADANMPGGSQCTFYKMCPHSMPMSIEIKEAQNNNVYLAAFTCKWILIGPPPGFWYCMPI